MDVWKRRILWFKGLPEPCVDVFCYCTFQELVGWKTCIIVNKTWAWPLLAFQCCSDQGPRERSHIVYMAMVRISWDIERVKLKKWYDNRCIRKISHECINNLNIYLLFLTERGWFFIPPCNNSWFHEDLTNDI